MTRKARKAPPVGKKMMSRRGTLTPQNTLEAVAPHVSALRTKYDVILNRLRIVGVFYDLNVDLQWPHEQRRTYHG